MPRKEDFVLSSSRPEQEKANVVNFSVDDVGLSGSMRIEGLEQLDERGRKSVEGLVESFAQLIKMNVLLTYELSQTGQVHEDDYLWEVQKIHGVLHQLMIEAPVVSQDWKFRGGKSEQ